VPTDLAALAAMGASALTIASYMSVYGKSWNYNITQQPGTMSKEESNAVAVLNKAGLTKATVGGPSMSGIPLSVLIKGTPAQQLAAAKLAGVVPNDAISVLISASGAISYTLPVNSSNLNGIPADLYAQFLKSWNSGAYARAGKPAPLNFDNTVQGQVTVTPYNNPANAVTFTQPQGTYYMFKNVNGSPVITALMNSKTQQTILKANSDGTFNLSDVYNAVFISKTLTPNSAIAIIGGSGFNQAQLNHSIMAILDNPANGLKDKNGNYDLAKALSQKNVTVADLESVGFSSAAINQAQINNSIMAILNNPKNGLKLSDGSYDLAKALANKNVTAADLKAVGFTVPKATTSTAASSAGPPSTAIMTEINTALTSKKPNIGNVSALNYAIENAGLWNNKLLGKTVYLGGTLFYVDSKGNVLTQQQQVAIEWNALTPAQQQQVAGSYSQDLYRTNPFAETTKQIAEAGAQGGIIGQLATAPLTGIALPIAKATTGQKVTPMEIVGGVATAVGDALMVGGGEALVGGLGNAGKVITNSLVTGLGTLGIANTIIQAKQGKTPASTLAVEAALSVAMVVIGGANLVSSVVPKGTPDEDISHSNSSTR
jgi:hypothetical protein